MNERRKRKNWPRETIAEYLRISEFHCQVCGQFDTRLQKCHVDALVDGGTDELDNMALLCGRCHRATEGIGWSAFDELVATTKDDRRRNEIRSLREWTLIASQMPHIAAKIDSQLLKEGTAQIRQQLREE